MPDSCAPILPDQPTTMRAAPLPASLRLGGGDVTVFMLHGVGGGKEVWHDTLEAVATAGFHAIAWDMPGYGDSAPIDPCTTRGLAEALECLIDAVGARRNILLGHSMGGMVAQEAVALYPRKVQGLVLSATSAAFGRTEGDWQQRFLRSRFAPLDAGAGMAGLAASLVPAMMGPYAPAAAMELARQVMSRVPESSYRAALQAIVSFNRLGNLANITVPTLCLAGELDQNASPTVMQKMAQRIPGADYTCLPGAGHLANLEQAPAFDRCVVDFLQRHFVPQRIRA